MEIRTEIAISVLFTRVKDALNAASGDRYIERERLPADFTSEGKQFLVGNFTFENWIPLQPHRS